MALGGRGSVRPVRPRATAPDVGLLVAAAMAPATFDRSLSPRSALDQGLVTGLTTGLHYLLSAGTQDLVDATARYLAGGTGAAGRSAAGGQLGTLALDCAAVPVGLALTRSLPAHPGESLLRGLLRQAAWRAGATGLGGALLGGTGYGVRALDARLGLGGRLVAVPWAIPVGLGVAYVGQWLRSRTEEDTDPGDDGGDDSGAANAAPPGVRSLALALGIVGGLSAAGRGEQRLAELVGSRLARALPGPPQAWRLVGHAGALTALGAGVTSLWHRAMQRIEAGTSASAAVIEEGEATRWVPATASGGPGSLVPWETLGREGRRHALASVRPRPLPTRPGGLPDLSIETVMGEPARAAPVQAYVGLDSAGSPRERVDLALAELERTGAFERSLIVLVSPTGTGYVNYVAVAAVQYLALGDVATVTLQYSRRPSPLSLGMVKAAREQNRLLWLRVLERVRAQPRPRPRVVLFGESLGAHTSQDVFLHWGTLGLEALGIDRALWIGTPYGSKWKQQITGADRLDVDHDTVAVVNDFGQLAALPAQRRAALRYVLLDHDNDGVTKFGVDLLTTPPRWLGPGRPRPQAVPGGSPRGIPAGMRWQPITTFFQTLIDMKNAQTPGAYRAWAHDYRADLPRFVAEVYGLPASAAQLARVEEALRLRESLRERLFAGPAPAPAGDRAVHA
jgi:uncharacterized membrane protein